MITIDEIRKQVLYHFQVDGVEWELFTPENQLQRVVFDDIMVIIGIENNQIKLVIADNDFSYSMIITHKEHVKQLILSYLFNKFSNDFQ